MLNHKILKNKYMLFISIIFAINIAAKSLLVEAIVAKNEKLSAFEKLSIDVRQKAINDQLDLIDREIERISSQISHLVEIESRSMYVAKDLLVSMASLSFPVWGLWLVNNKVSEAYKGSNLVIGSYLFGVYASILGGVRTGMRAMDNLLKPFFTGSFSKSYVKESLLENRNLLKELVSERDILTDYLKKLDTKIN